MTIKRTVCLLTLCCVLLLPLTATAAPVYNETLRMTLGGDVDGDGALTSTDARLVLVFSIIKSTPGAIGSAEFEEWHALRTRAHAIADMDEDGKITSTDARLILQYAVGKESTLPRPESLPYEKLETAPAGEAVSFKTAEILKDYKHYYNSSTDHRFSVAQTPAEWNYLRTTYGFTATYNAAFFEQNALVVCDIWMNATRQLLEIKQITKSGSTLELHVRKYYETPYSEQGTYHAQAVVEIPKTALNNADSLAVYFQHDPALPIM